MEAPTVRDRLFDGVVACLIGMVPMAFGVGLLFVDGGDGGRATFVAVLVGIGALFVALGASWIARRLTFEDGALSVRGWRGTRRLRTGDLVSVRGKMNWPAAPHATSGQRLRLRDVRGGSVTLYLGSSATTEAARAWLPQAYQVIANRWRSELASGGAVTIGPQVRLTDGHLTARKTRIDLSGTFDLEEVPGTSVAAPLLRVSARDKRIVIQCDWDNAYPLAHFLRTRRDA